MGRQVFSTTVCFCRAKTSRTNYKLPIEFVQSGRHQLLADIKDAVWPIEPHTKAKHQILEEYLKAWYPILSSWQGRVLYLDGFAGPGTYSGGEDGSPRLHILSIPHVWWVLGSSELFADPSNYYVAISSRKFNFVSLMCV